MGAQIRDIGDGARPAPKKQLNSRGMRNNGRGAGKPPFTMALHAITDHPDYKCLLKQTRAFLWDFARQYNGYNNGNLSAAPGTMGKYGWSKWELMRAREEAEKAGWIEVTRLPRAKREPTLYRLTWMEADNWYGKPILDAGAHAQKKRSLR